LQACGAGWSCTVTAEDDRYRIVGCVAYPAGDVEGLVGHVMAMASAQNSTGSGSAGQRTAGDAGRSSREMGSGELALRRLRDEGVI
jgi:hypothetical protein